MSTPMRTTPPSVTLGPPVVSHPVPAGNGQVDAHGMDDASPLGIQTPCLQSNALLQGHSSVAIQHNGSIYRLQATKLGKLILTK